MIQKLVFRWLRVPPQPAVPSGAGEVQTFRAGKNFFTYQQIMWGLKQLGALAGLYYTSRFMVPQLPELARRIAYLLEIIGWTTFVVQIPFTYVIRRLDYEYRWYIVTDRSLRIREGVTTIREKTMTFANIQNMTVRQGPVQRFLAIADLEIRTAGGGGSSGKKGEKSLHEDLHLAYFRGVSNAAAIRDLISTRVRQHRDSGLGDPDEPRFLSLGQSGSALEAARELLLEVRRLGGALSQR